MKKGTRSNSRTSIELFDCLNYSKIIPTLSKTDVSYTKMERVQIAYERRHNIYKL